MLVDDDPAAVRDLTRHLLGLGFDEVLSFDDVAPALHMLQHDAWDLTVVDLALRTSYGLFVLDALSDRESHRRVVVYSVNATEEARQTASQLGADEYFHRPTQEQDLLAFCRRVIR